MKKTKQKRVWSPLKWTLIILGVLGIPFTVWKGWAVLLYRKIYALVMIKISLGYIMLAFCLAVFLFWLINRFVKTRKEKQLNWPGIAVIPGYGYQEVGSRIYGGVKWVLQLPNPGPFDSSPLLPRPSALQIAQKLKLEGPFCPKCNTELEESKSLFQYRQVCVKCGFQKRGKIPIYKLREKAERIFKAEFREYLLKQEKNK